MSSFLELCERAARAGGEILLEKQGKVTPIAKGPNDLVTEADFASQKVVLEILSRAHPDHLMLAEENTGGDADRDSQHAGPIGPDQYRWIVDPLDGTINYVHNAPSYAVSVALERGGELLVGVVYDPVMDECFTAAAGDGAFLNGQRIHTSTCDAMKDALVAVSFSTKVARGSVEIRRFVEVLHESHTIRRLGSAALNLCYLASGRLDGYFANAVKTWDVAAGMLILREAGGIVSAPGGGPFDLYRPQFACAATDRLQAELVEILARVE